MGTKEECCAHRRRIALTSRAANAPSVFSGEKSTNTLRNALAPSEVAIASAVSRSRFFIAKSRCLISGAEGEAEIKNRGAMSACCTVAATGGDDNDADFGVSGNVAAGDGTGFMRNTC